MLQDEKEITAGFRYEEVPILCPSILRSTDVPFSG